MSLHYSAHTFANVLLLDTLWFILIELALYFLLGMEWYRVGIILPRVTAQWFRSRSYWVSEKTSAKSKSPGAGVWWPPSSARSLSVPEPDALFQRKTYVYMQHTGTWCLLHTGQWAKLAEDHLVRCIVYGRGNRGSWSLINQVRTTK